MREEAITPDTEAEQCVNQVLNLSNGILEAMHADRLQELTQLLLRRGRLISSLGSLDLQSLKGETRMNLEQKLARINALEPAIQEGLKNMTQEVALQLRAATAHKNVVSHYKVSSEGGSTRTDQA